MLIRRWRGDVQLSDWLEEREVAIDTIVRLEFLQGANKRQAADALVFVDKFYFIPFSSQVSFVADGLVRKFSHEKGLRAGDALIAATALVEDLPLYTFNRRHFDFIDGLVLL